MIKLNINNMWKLRKYAEIKNGLLNNDGIRKKIIRCLKTNDTEMQHKKPSAQGKSSSKRKFCDKLLSAKN